MLTSTQHPSGAAAVSQSNSDEQVQNPIDLPQIVVVGSQSSGKSSVLENIVGRDLYAISFLDHSPMPS